MPSGIIDLELMLLIYSLQNVQSICFHQINSLVHKQSSQILMNIECEFDNVLFRNNDYLHWCTIGHAIKIATLGTLKSSHFSKK